MENGTKKYTKAEITDLVEDTLNTYSLKESYPVLVIELANKIGLQVFKASFDRDDIASVIEPIEKKIYVSQIDNPKRQRFSIVVL